MQNTQKYLKVAVQAAKESGPIFKKFFGRPKDIKTKNGDPRNLVTEIDKGIETNIRKIIAKNFPTHKIIGEEFGSGEIKKDDLIWILDPIDGTTNYIQGLPICCICIGLWDSKGPLVSVLYNPVLGQMYTAARGQGAKLNGKKITVSNSKSLFYSLGGVGWLKVETGAKLFMLMVKICRKLRILASSAWQICLIGSANYDFQVSYDINIWDFGAAALITQEAGGKVTDWDGKPITLQSRNILATNGKIHNELIKQLKKLPL